LFRVPLKVRHQLGKRRFYHSLIFLMAGPAPPAELIINQ
jgi:hypothetical protein